MSIKVSANGDLERAFFELAPKDRHTEERIAAMLGFQAKDEGKAQVDIIEELPFPPPEHLALKKVAEERPETQPVPRGEPLPAILRQVRAGAAAEAPEWLHEIQPLERPGLQDEELPPAAPLFAPDKTRSILAVTLSALREFGPIQIERIVETIARGDIVRDMPRRPVSSMASAIQLLIDRGDGMLPFLSDLDQIEGAFQAVFGTMLRVINFASCPSRKAGRGSRVTWKPYFPDLVGVSGTRVICVTDLGIGHPVGGVVPAGPEEWLEFHKQLQKRGSSLVVLTPYGPSRWPATLAKRLTILHWDCKTTAASASAALGKMHR